MEQNTAQFGKRNNSRVLPSRPLNRRRSPSSPERFSVAVRGRDTLAILIIMSTTKRAKVKADKLPEKGSTTVERGIYRVNYPSHKGIRAYLKFKDTEYQKVFNLKGGERKALAQARRWRKEKLREIQNSPEAQNPLRPIQANNKSGIVGVRRGKTAWSATWSATWTENGKQFHRSFSIDKFGEEEAFRLARQARAEAEKRIYGQVFQDALKSNER